MYKFFDKKLETAVEIIKSKLYTPLIYATEDEHGISFICIIDGNIMLKDLYKIKQSLKKTIGKNVDIVDIFDISLNERMDLVHHGDPLYSQSDFTKEILENAILEENKINSYMKSQLLDRKNTCKTSYLC